MKTISRLKENAINPRRFKKCNFWNGDIYSEIDRGIDRKHNKSNAFLKVEFLEC